MFHTASARVATACTLMLLNLAELREGDREEGQGLVEYGLILALIAVVCVGALIAIGGNINDMLSKLGLDLGGDAAPAAPAGP